ncbi:hypothetical protein HMI54_004093 [Coelomomyces lativittatus]|nr:hypothetical protein HMI54_004093 [Coelomomyces lativittatus]KAJ1507738.1 hypothetical protein HMI56_007639 [Coelomomyces lativittatus]KAJ1512386.1 hypothetical protein HMI55_006257 [Coelomomyces lativittatus]
MGKFQVSSNKLKVFIKLLFPISFFVLFVGFIFLNVILFNPSFRKLITSNDAVQRVLQNPLSIPGIFFGVTIDWAAGDTPKSFTQSITRPPILYNHFVDVYDQVQFIKELKYIVDLIANTYPCILSLTVMPSKGFSVMKDSTYDQLGRIMKTINDLDIPVFVRYAHEMNGNWYAYGQQPVAYKNSFIKLTNAIRKYTSLTKMVWAPNSASGYPSYGGDVAVTPSKNNNATEFASLDTNKDGLFNSKDDPYSPYYPGDEYVDWVGFSTFAFGDSSRPSGNKLPDPNEFVDSIDPTGTWSIYKSFVSAKSKPLVVMETASTFYPNNTLPSDPSNYEIKKAWWTQMFSTETRGKIPMLKLISWFNVQKVEKDLTNTPSLRDFTLTSDPKVASAFVKNLPNFIYFADTKF